MLRNTAAFQRGGSSDGRAAVSKTACRRFEPCPSCAFGLGIHLGKQVPTIPTCALRFGGGFSKRFFMSMEKA